MRIFSVRASSSVNVEVVFLCKLVLSCYLCATLDYDTCFSKADLESMVNSMSAEKMVFVFFCRLLLSASKMESLIKLQKLSRGIWGRNPETR